PFVVIEHLVEEGAVLVGEPRLPGHLPLDQGVGHGPQGRHRLPAGPRRLLAGPLFRLQRPLLVVALLLGLLLGAARLLGRPGPPRTSFTRLAGSMCRWAEMAASAAPESPSRALGRGGSSSLIRRRISA